MVKQKQIDIPLRLPDALPWLRLLAVILVFTGHSQLRAGCGQGSIFFLVLSGYTFTRIFIKEWTQNEKLNYRRFLGRRLNKIAPALLIVLALNVLIQVIIDHPVNISQVLSVATFTTNYYNAFHDHPNNGLSHLWTISALMQFYVLWPLLFTLLVRACHSLYTITIYLSLTILAVVLYRSVLVCLDLAPSAYIYNSLETRVDCILIGAIFAFNVEHPCMQKMRAMVLKYKWTLALTIVAITSMSFLPIIVRNTVGFDVHAALFGILLIQLGAIQSSWPAPEALLTDVSYWFYLLHPWGNSIGKYLPLNPYGQVFFGGLILLLAIAIFCKMRQSSKAQGLKILARG